MISNRVLLTRLLRRNVSGSQILAYVVSLLLGLIVVLCGVGFLSDVATHSRDTESNYVVVAKKVDALGGLAGQEATFSDLEIDDLKGQTWVERVGEFKRADFDVFARVAGGSSSMSTSLFLESVPNSFLDFDSTKFVFNASSQAIVPVLISKEYLMLYNHGFAPARGLPQMSESVVEMVPITLSISGNGTQRNFMARIVGFSSRLNTIAVPESFIDYADSIFSEKDGAGQVHSRLIVETLPDAGADVARYAALNNLEIGGAPLMSGTFAKIVKVAVGFIMGVGAIIMFLAIFIITMSIHLLLYKNRKKMVSLIMLGFKPSQVATPYVVGLVAMNFAITLIAAVAALFARELWLQPLNELGVTGSSAWPMLVIAAAIFAILSVVNTLTILTDIRRR